MNVWRVVFLCVCSALFCEEESFVRTAHLYRAAKIEIPYEAVTGMIPVKAHDGSDLAELFFIAYFAVEKNEQRPITFIFPGGPGGSIAGEVICSFGPKRLVLPEEGQTRLPPYRMIDNPESLLPWTDLVFIDPARCGYSTVNADADEDLVRDLFSVDGDIDALSRCIQTFISLFDRWNCPKYLGGFSYGATRSCALTEALGGRGISLNGVLLLSSAIDFNALLTQFNHPLPDALLIPTLAAAAWHHKKTACQGSLTDVVDYARRFVADEYIPAHFNPSRLSRHEKEGLHQTLSRLIGLPVTTIRRFEGRLSASLFAEELFADERKLLGIYDMRYAGDATEIVPNARHEDPSYNDVHGIAPAFQHYLKNSLDTHRPFDRYVFHSRHISRTWDYGTYDSLYWPDMLQRLRHTMAFNPEMAVFVGSGYYDGCTPFAAIEHCFNHLGLPDESRENIVFSYYEAGHGLLFHLPSLKQLKKDLAWMYNRRL
ncbi:MAG: hypothetical protein RL235_565 [Chlamydiota bacterium]|jgi:carboxypeptidase C (cathepsin A)